MSTTMPIAMHILLATTDVWLAVRSHPDGSGAVAMIESLLIGAKKVLEAMMHLFSQLVVALHIPFVFDKKGKGIFGFPSRR